MNSHRKRSQGFAVVVVLLVSMVALGAIVTTASLSSLSARQVAGDERQSTIALFAAESALNTVLARSRTAAYAYDEDVHTSVYDWLTTVGLNTMTWPNGASVTLAALDEAGGRVTLRAVGTAASGATRTVFQDFVLYATELDPTLFADAALLTKDALATNSKNSRMDGRDLLEEDWMFTEVLGHARDGEYVEIDSVLYKVSDRADDGSSTLTSLDGATVYDPNPTPGSTVV